MPHHKTLQTDEVNCNRRKKEHTFNAQFHHPIIHWMQHITSPLTAALLIFGIHKSWQVRIITATLRSAVLFARARSTVEFREIFINRLPELGITACAGTGIYVLYKNRPNSGEHHELQDKIKQLYKDQEQASLVAQAIHHWWTKDYVLLTFQKLRERFDVPCWAAIVIVTICLRICLVPVNIALLRTSLRLKCILPECYSLAAKIKDKTLLTDHARLEHARQLHRLLMKNGCNPWAQLIVLPLLLPPVVLSIFGAVQEMCLTEPRMEVEGLLWFPDLIERDETQFLAIISCLTWLLNIEIGAGVHYTNHRTLRTAVRLGAVSMISLSATLPSGVFVFWITSNVFALCRGFLMRSDTIRIFFRIPTQRTIASLPHL